MSHKVLVLPNWQGGGPAPWPMHWVQRHGYTLVAQHDLVRPRRGDWLARLDEVVADTAASRDGILLAAHGLGCILVAAWAAFSRHTGRVAGALLVAPTDVERADLRERLPGWSPVLRQRLPFAATVVAHHGDPDGGADRTRDLASDWGAHWLAPGATGHPAGHAAGDWPAAHVLLPSLQNPLGRLAHAG